MKGMNGVKASIMIIEDSLPDGYSQNTLIPLIKQAFGDCNITVTTQKKFLYIDGKFDVVVYGLYNNFREFVEANGYAMLGVIYINFQADRYRTKENGDYFLYCYDRKPESINLDELGKMKDNFESNLMLPGASSSDW